MKFKTFISFAVGLFISLSAGAETYQQACRVIGEDDYVQYQIEFETPLQANAEFNLKLTAFEDENCKIPYLQYNQYFHVADLKSKDLNLKTDKVTYSTLSDEVTDALNMIHYCGIGDWKTKSETNVTGQVCDDFQQLAAGQILFQIFQKSDEKIQFGKVTSKQDGRSENQRPIAWDDLEFTKILVKPSLAHSK